MDFVLLPFILRQAQHERERFVGSVRLGDCTLASTGSKKHLNSDKIEVTR